MHLLQVFFRQVLQTFPSVLLCKNIFSNHKIFYLNITYSFCQMGQPLMKRVWEPHPISQTLNIPQHLFTAEKLWVAQIDYYYFFFLVISFVTSRGLLQEVALIIRLSETRLYFKQVHF